MTAEKKQKIIDSINPNTNCNSKDQGGQSAFLYISQSVIHSSSDITDSFSCQDARSFSTTDSDPVRPGSKKNMRSNQLHGSHSNAAESKSAPGNLRHRRMLKTVLILLVLGFAYLIWLQITHAAIPCPFRAITGWKCPGCGITTMLWNLAHLDFARAFRANPFLFITGPFLLAEILYTFTLQWKGKRLPKWNETLLLCYGLALCIFGFCRNL